MVEGHGAGRTRERYRAAEIQVAGRRVDGAAKVAAGMMIVDLSPVRARHDHHRSVLLRHVVQVDPGGETVVIRVGIKGPILMPFDGSPYSGALMFTLWL